MSLVLVELEFYQLLAEMQQVRDGMRVIADHVHQLPKLLQSLVHPVAFLSQSPAHFVAHLEFAQMQSHLRMLGWFPLITAVAPTLRR
jgi:hypothetical protein